MHIYVHKSDIDWNTSFHELASSFNATVADNKFYPAAAFGTGKFVQRILSSDLAIYEMSYTLAMTSYTVIAQSKTELFKLIFSWNRLPASAIHRVQIGDIDIATDENWKHSFLLSSHTDFLAIQPVGFQTSRLTLSFTRRWLDKEIGSEAASHFLDAYLLLRHNMFSAMQLTEVMEQKSEWIKAAISSGIENNLIETECRELANIYFKEIAIVMQALSGSIFNEIDTLLLLRHVHTSGTVFFLNPATRDELSVTLGMSSSKLGNLFRDTYKQSYSAYLLARRMDWAAARLSTGTVKAGEIADALGYENHSRFSDAFRKHTGVLPSDIIKALTKDKP